MPLAAFATAPMRGPILSPDEPWEGSCAMPFSGGVFKVDGQYRLYYLANYKRVCVAFSDDGLTWTKPDVGIVPGTNILLQHAAMDSFSVVQHGGRWFMTISQASGGPLRLLESRYGLWWNEVAVMPWAGDRTTLWWNPVKERWTFNVRNGGGTASDPRRIDRVESESFSPRSWEPVPWLVAEPGDGIGPSSGGANQLYAVDVVPDGGRLIGLFTIWRGQEAERPKLNDVCLGFSLDGGDTWARRYEPVLTRSETPGAWNYGNVQGCSGGLVRLSPWSVRLYASGRSGDGRGGNGRCSMGYRDLVL